jgi:ABC-type glutathione transport system ATPase component
MDEVPILEARQLRKVFPGRRGSVDRVAVAGSDISVSRGESVGIVGESGSGKTTLARMLVGLEQPTEGTLLIDGAELSGRVTGRDRRALARRVQLVFQDPYSSLDPMQTVESSIDEALRLHFELDSKERRDRIQALMETVGLDSSVGRARPRSLSGGQRQRVAIARAIACDPAVIILDEAVAALDVSVQAQVLNMLRHLRQETDMALVVVSHDLAVIANLTDRLQVMQRGHVVEAGETHEVLLHPGHPYTQNLIDSVPRKGWTPQHSS